MGFVLASPMRNTLSYVYILLAPRGAVGKRQGISIPYPSPTPLLTPGGIRCGGAYLLPRLTGIWSACIRCRLFVPTSTYRLVALCSGLDCSRFNWVVGLVSHVFHYWGEGLFVPAATVGFAMVYSWICANRDWSVCLNW